MYTFLKWLVKVFLRLYHRVEMDGLKNIPISGPLIVTMNHVSYLDPIYLEAMFPRHIHFMAKKELFQNRWLGSFLRRIGTFPVDRGKADLHTTRTSIEYLKKNQVVGLFPEGGIRENNVGLQDLKQGAAYLSVKGKAPIIPVYIGGTDKALKIGDWWVKPTKIKIKIGSVLYPPEGESVKDKQKKLSEEILLVLNQMVSKSADAKPVQKS